MFLVKSTFWLGLAFIIIKPVAIDISSKREAIKEAAINSGQRAIIQQLTSSPCEDIKCSKGKALTLAATFVSNIELGKNNEQEKTPKPMPRIKRDG